MSLPDLSLLAPLVALLEEESVSAAATRTGVTQPAMSRTLARLRVVTGDELLVKVGRGLRRTTRGDALLSPAQSTLAQASSLLSSPQPFSPSTATGTATLAMGDDLQTIIANAVLLRLRERAPGLDVRLRMLAVATVDEARRGVVDLALIPLLPYGMPPLDDFVLRPLFQRRFVTVTRHKRRLDLDRFCAAEHILVSPQGSDGGYVDDSLQKLKRRRRIAVTVQTFAGAIKLLQQSDTLVATLPLDLVRLLGSDLVVQKCPVATPTFPICLAWQARVSQDARHRFLRDVVVAGVGDVVGAQLIPNRSATEKSTQKE